MSARAALPRFSFAARIFGWRTPRATFWVALLALVGAPLAVHAPELLGFISNDPLPGANHLNEVELRQLISGRPVVDGNVGGTLQALGHLSAEQWLSFHLPWWNPFSGVGMPLAAEMQPASFYLPFILLLHFANGVLFLKITTQIMAGLCMFACLRELRLAAGTGLFGALLWEFNGTFAWYGDAPHLPLPFLPLLVTGIMRAANRQAHGTAIIAIAIAYSLFAGFPETAFVDGLLALFWAGVLATGMPLAALRQFGFRVMFGGLIGLCLAAPVVVPFLDYLGHASVALRGDVAFQELNQAQFATLLLPTLFGPPHFDWNIPGWSRSGGYIGAGVARSGLAGLLFHRGHARLRILAALWTLFWIAAFLGEPITRAIWHATPVLSEIAITRYAMPSVSFLWVVLASFGWERWRQGGTGFLAPVLTAFLAAIGVAAAFRVHRLSWAGLEASPYALLTIGWTTFLLGAVTLLLRGSPDTFRRRCAAALLLVDAAASFALPIATGHFPASLDLAPIQFLKSQPGFARSVSIGRKLTPNYGAYFGVPTLESISLPTPALWANFTQGLDPGLGAAMVNAPDPAAQAARLAARRAELERAGVAFVLVDSTHDPLAGMHDPHFVPVFQSQTTRIYHMPGAAPYFQITQGGPCELVVQSRTKIETNCSAPATLERRELFFPGWHASVEDRKAAITQAAPVFQQIALPAGSSRVRFTFAPQHAAIIALAFAAGLFGSLAALFIPRRRPDATDRAAHSAGGIVL